MKQKNGLVFLAKTEQMVEFFRDFIQKHMLLQQALLKGGDVPVDSGTSMTEQEIAYILGKLKTSEARERFLRSL